MNALQQPDVPIYLDTNVLWHAPLIAKLRATFPQRSLCVPSIAHFERVRQLRLEWGEDFDAAEIETFVNTYGLVLIPFDPQTAHQMAEMVDHVELRALIEIGGEDILPPETRREALIQHGDALWQQQANWLPIQPKERTDVTKHPCGQRCRVSDYIVAATAKIGGGILVSDDRAFLDAAVKYPDLFPQTVGSEQVNEMLEHLFSGEIAAASASSGEI